MRYNLNWEKGTVIFKFETQKELQAFMDYVHKLLIGFYIPTDNNKEGKE